MFHCLIRVNVAFMLAFMVVSVIAHSHDVEHTHGSRDSATILTNMNVDELSVFRVWISALTSTALIGAAPVLILLILPAHTHTEEAKSKLKILLAFSSGGLLGDVFLHLLPHSSDSAHAHTHTHSSHDHHHHHHHDTHNKSGYFVLAGLLSFLMIEKIIRCMSPHASSVPTHKSIDSDSFSTSKKVKDKDLSAALVQPHHQLLKKRRAVIADDDINDDDDKHDGDHLVDTLPKQTNVIAASAYLNLAADFTHNFTDGLAVGASFQSGASIGFVTVIAVLAHEIPHEIGDYAILLASGVSRPNAIALQLVTALGAMIGTVVGLLGGGTGPFGGMVLPYTAGGFIYISTVNVLPELLNNSKPAQSMKEVLAIGAGIALMAIVAVLE